MPVIFASAILMFPAQLLRTLGAAIADSPSETNWAIDLANVFASRGWFYYIVYGGLILVFSYFWVSIMFKPVQIADDLKKNGGYVPGVRPGDPTAKFLDFTMTRLTLAGAIFLTVIAVFPDLIFNLANVSYNVAMFSEEQVCSSLLELFSIQCDKLKLFSCKDIMTAFFEKAESAGDLQIQTRELRLWSLRHLKLNGDL